MTVPIGVDAGVEHQRDRASGRLTRLGIQWLPEQHSVADVKQRVANELAMTGRRDEVALSAVVHQTHDTPAVVERCGVHE